MPSSGEKGGRMTVSGHVQLFMFCVFEACVGIFWPSIMKLRSQHIPEASRSTILNFFRIPVNVFVCIVLYNVRGIYKPMKRKTKHQISPWFSKIIRLLLFNTKLYWYRIPPVKYFKIPSLLKISWPVCRTKLIGLE